MIGEGFLKDSQFLHLLDLMAFVGSVGHVGPRWYPAGGFMVVTLEVLYVACVVY